MKNSINTQNANIHSIGLLNTEFRTSVTSHLIPKIIEKLPEILFITTYPPRECGIATYSQDLIKSLNSKFKNSFDIQICAVESDTEKHQYNESIKYILNADHTNSFYSLSDKINASNSIKVVLLQHEFGL